MEVGARPPAEHLDAGGREAIDRVEEAAAEARGRRVLHVSAAAGGGGVPDLLGGLLPLSAGAGVDVQWQVLFGDPDFHAVAAGLHEGLQGAESAIDDEAFERYLEDCANAVERLHAEDGFDVVVLHDPPTLGLAPALAGRHVVWRCHVDASRPDVPAWERAEPLVSACEEVVFPDPGFAPEATGDRVRAIAPGIDPLSPRNADLGPGVASRVLRRLGADLERPLCSQLMRLDGWKDPHAALEAFALAREELPQLQFVIACRLDGTDAEWRAVKEISDYAAGSEGVHVFTSYGGNVGDLELGALNQLSRLALRLSLREGFGLACSEAMWRRTPVVGGRAGGTALQVRDGVDGYLVEGTDRIAERIVEIVGDPGLATEMGQSAHERVREHFLITRVLEDELRLLASVGTR